MVLIIIFLYLLPKFVFLMNNFCQVKGQQHQKNMIFKEKFSELNLKYILAIVYNKTT
jgi:hypothetical protein